MIDSTAYYLFIINELNQLIRENVLPLVIRLEKHQTLIFLDKQFDFKLFLLKKQVFIIDVKCFKLSLVVVFLIKLFNDSAFDL